MHHHKISSIELNDSKLEALYIDATELANSIWDNGPQDARNKYICEMLDALATAIKESDRKLAIRPRRFRRLPAPPKKTIHEMLFDL